MTSVILLRALAEGLKGNQVIKELNFSDSNLGSNFNDATDTSGIVAIADVIPGMGAMTSLNLSSNMLTGRWGDDMSGSNITAPNFFLQVLSPLPLPSATWGR